MAASITARTWILYVGCATVLILCCLLVAVEGSSAELTVSGWPQISIPLDKPDNDFGDEPIIGRQICPPLTRLNLKTKSSEGVVIRRAVEEFRSQKKGSLWRFEIRTGIFWWSGAPVTSEDIAKSLSSYLKAFLAETYKEVFPVPGFNISATDSQTVTVDWKEPPLFGPYVLNGMPLFRSVDEGFAGLKYECAGNYRPESLHPVVLVPASGYVFSSRLPQIKFLPDNDPKADIKFLFSEASAGKDAALCTVIWPSPFFSVISWNLATGRTAGSELRKLMTGLIPRKEIISAGVLGYADAVSAPIPRMHPGYNPRALDVTFDATKVSASLDALGFRRKKPHSTRTDSKGHPLRLNIISNSKDEGLVEKLMSDSFSSVGLEVDFVESAGKGHEDIDGHFTTLQTDYPRIDFLTLLHPKAPAVEGFWKVKDPAFTKMLEDYALSLTSEKPDFSLLSNIHQYLAANQVYSVIAHHRACIKTANTIKLSSSSVMDGDPDWFRDLLF